jgi:sugar phosphate isomerase/epimerase
MTVANRIGGHTNSYHNYSLEQSLEGIAGAGFKYVELSAVRGWTEHVPLEADSRTLSAIQRQLNQAGLIAISLSGHSDLTTKAGLEDGLKALRLTDALGLDIMNTAIGGHYSENEDESAFMGNITDLAEAAAKANILIGIEIHGDITSSGHKAIPVIQKINHPNVRINYDTANIEFYDTLTAVEDLPEAASWCVHCHLKDKIGGHRVWNFPAVGDGHVDFKRVFELFDQAQFKGPYSVEIEFTGEWPSVEGVHEAMKRSYNHLHSIGAM